MGIRRARHVGITYLVEHIPILWKRRNLVSVFINLLIFIFLFMLVKEGFSLAILAKRQISPAMGISMFWPYFGFLIGAVAMAIQVLHGVLFGVLSGEVLVIQDDCSLQSE